MNLFYKPISVAMLAVLASACVPQVEPAEDAADPNNNPSLIDPGDNSNVGQKIDVQLVSTAESYVEQGEPSTNMAGSSWLVAKMSDSESTSAREIYVQFDLSPYANLTTAEKDALNVEIAFTYQLAGDAAEADVSVYRSLVHWQESEVSWNTRLPRNLHVEDFKLTPSFMNEDATFRFDVTAQARSALATTSSLLTLVITNSKNGKLKIYPRNSAGKGLMLHLTNTQSDSSTDQGNGQDGDQGSGQGTDTGSGTDTDKDTGTGPDQGTDQGNTGSTGGGTDTGSSTDTGEGSGEGSNTDSGADNGTDSGSGSNTGGTENQTAIERGKTLWSQHSCNACHGDQGDGEPRGSSILPSLSSGDVKALIINTMPVSAPQNCESDCADDILAYISSVNGLEYNGGSQSGGSETDENENITDGRKDLDQAAQQKRLYKASMNLLSRLPTAQERALVSEKGSEGFETVLLAMMEETGFYERLREIYTPLLIDPAAPQVGSYLAPFGNRGRWAFDVYASSRARALYANGHMITALNQEPMRMIEYIVKNNRPYTEILTADYTLLNYFSAQAYNKAEQLEFRHLENPTYDDVPWDPEHYVPVSFTEFPQAGLLTQMHFLKTYPTTATNVNRHRAYTVFKLFLDFDLLEISGSRTLADDILVDDPTRNSPACTGCHQIMDPVASTFRHWQIGTQRRSNLTQAKWDQSSILLPGFNGKEMDEGNPAPLVWLAKELVQDPRFAISTVKTFFTEMTGAKVLPVPESDASQLEHQRYEFQKQVIKDIAERFAENNYNLKGLMVDLLSTDYFNDQDFVGGAAQLLSADRLKRKLMATTGQDSYTGSDKYLNGSIYTGEQPSGTMALIQRLTGSSIACEAITPDVAKTKAERLLLPFYDASQSVLSNSGQVNSSALSNVDKNIQNLMWVMWGQSVELNSPRLAELRELYLLAVQEGRSSASSDNLDSTCRSSGISSDDDYQLRAWMMLLNLMIDDFRFYYE